MFLYLSRPNDLKGGYIWYLFEPWWSSFCCCSFCLMNSIRCDWSYLLQSEKFLKGKYFVICTSKLFIRTLSVFYTVVVFMESVVFHIHCVNSSVSKCVVKHIPCIIVFPSEWLSHCEGAGGLTFLFLRWNWTNMKTYC